MELLIPQAPEQLHVLIERYWNGDACEDATRHAELEIEQTDTGLSLTARAPSLLDQRAPDAPPGRFDGLWDFDVVELFLVGQNGRYLEIELGARGHWLILGFDAPRHRENSYADFVPQTTFVAGNEGGKWEHRILVPWTMIPSPLARMNAYAISGSHFLAFSPVPGTELDFHRPEVFPTARIESKE